MLLRQHDVAYVHSGTVLVAMRQDQRDRKRPKADVEIVGLGFPYDVEAEGESDLPETELALLERGGPRRSIPATAQEVLGAALGFATNEKERETLEATAKALEQDKSARVQPLAGERFRVFLRMYANERVLKSDPAVKQARIVHLACHGEADLTSPSLSRLVLARSGKIERKTGEDGYLYLRELRDLGLSCDLLVLSACESNGKSVSPLEGMTGLARAGLAGGARSVISTQWRVEDKTARDFMLAFYERWTRGGVSRIRAFNEAKRVALRLGWSIASCSAYVLWDVEVEER
jgi:CHAT domain-containing protein